MANIRPLERSPFSSPTRKRQRLLSSPDYDSHLPALSQEDLQAIEKIEFQLSQPHKDTRGNGTSNDNNSQGSEDPFARSSSPSYHAQQMKPVIGFTAASSFTLPQSDDRRDERSPSPGPSDEKDYSSWFDSGPSQTPMGFQTASFTSASSLNPKTGVQAVVGFRTAGNSILAPSGSALAKAQQKMKEIWGEDAPDTPDTSGENAFRTSSNLNTPVDSAQRGPLRSLGNASALSSIGTPCPPEAKTTTSISGFISASTSFASPLPSRVIDKHRPKPFRSPFLAQNKNAPATPTNRNAASSTPVLSGLASARPRHSLSTPASSGVFETPAKPSTSSSLALSTPARSIRTTRFVTPFKQGMKPGEPGREALEKQAKAGPSMAIATPAKKKVRSMFDLKLRPNRQTLLSSGLVPQRFTEQELKYYDLDYDELRRVTPETALYYNFYCPTPTPQYSDSAPFSLTTTSSWDLGATEAFQRLQAINCWLAKKDWVLNHWSLILWKLAGMVALDPGTESTERRRWSWNEIWNQLLYRYERELNMGIRPALRRITTHDSPAASPIVLCVSDIIWPPSQVANGQKIEPPPELEVTDGWYKLRARIDAPLIRAVEKGTLRIGRKIAIAGARLENERKDPVEVLEAYNSVKLIINGNASHLALWHTKLGFQKGPFISTLRSLTPDGGLVPIMDVIITQVHPIAYFEFSVDEKGKKRTEGPRNEAEEARCADQWKVKREAAGSRLREEHEKKIRRYLAYAERLEQKAGGSLRGNEPPDSIEDMYDELEEPDDAGPVLARASAHEAGWLAKHIRERVERDQDRARDEIEKELSDICPRRNLRCFRVVFIKDAQSNRRPANRKAQLTIWDVLDIQLSEGKPAGHFETGYRCIITNLMPSSQRAWMGHEPGSEVFLVTTRASRFQKLKS
ncbi:rad51-associated protein brh2 [Moniliophthora roreri MCA 2997]|uniref:Rad51-associated protein brh2 n=1 Tax=Moniliophthora roreri (strain MCA 2997) TaxID=1381753 RepID=V2XG77_MONRO|nr:rad51-associated protein brh2 [Moniliophthora roreri MCA 2997]